MSAPLVTGSSATSTSTAPESTSAAPSPELAAGAPEPASSRNDPHAFGAAAAHGRSVTLSRATKSWPARRGWRRIDKVVLDAVSLRIDSGEFIGLLGASGSGKSTLIKTVAGLIELDDGVVRLDGQLMTAEQLRGDPRIAYLPQDVIVHEELTARRALRYAARLKGLGRSRRDRAALVDRALERVGLAERMEVPIHRLSGGQRKRAALAAELLGDPGLILLDEATSGLDPASEADMMQLFRSIAKEGRTVICITHFPGRLTLCDRVLYLMDGKAVFFGTPVELRRFFAVDDIEEVYRRQSERSADEWREEFLSTATGADAFSEDDPGAREAHATTAAWPRASSSTHTASPSSTVTQLRVLFTRYADIQLRDFRSLLLLFLQAPVIALMVSAVFGDIRVPFVEQHAATTKEVIFVVVLAVLWCGGTLSVREIVKEQAVFRHEARIGLGVLPYAGSKILLLGAVSIMQALALLHIVRALTGLNGDAAVQTVVVALLAVVGVLLGLLVSAAASSTERAMTVLPVLLIAQAIFSGGLAQLGDVTLRLSQVLVPAWWALDGLRASFSSAIMFANYPGPPGGAMRPILGTGGPLALDLIALLLQGAAFLTALGLVLRWKRR